MNKEEAKQEMVKLAEKLGLNGSISGLDYAFIALSLLKKAELIEFDSDEIAKILAFWKENVPKNPSAMRQAIFERSESGESLSAEEMLAKKYGSMAE